LIFFSISYLIFVFFFNLVLILFIIISFGFIFFLNWFFFQIHPSLFDFIWFSCQIWSLFFQSWFSNPT
jgi:hypothetical protein